MGSRRREIAYTYCGGKRVVTGWNVEDTRVVREYEAGGIGIRYGWGGEVREGSETVVEMGIRTGLEEKKKGVGHGVGSW